MKGQNPYVGPRSLQTGEPLFGRDHELAELADLLIAERVVLLYAPSGAGKSSLVNAGLMPRLKDEDFQIFGPTRIAAGWRYHKADEEFTLTGIWSSSSDSQQILRGSNQTNELRNEMNKWLTQVKPGYQPLLIIDQFEEALAEQAIDAEGTRRFFESLGQALSDTRWWFLLVLREDFLAALTPYLPLLPKRLRVRYRLELLEPPAARVAIREPARRMGVEYEDGALDLLLDNLRMIKTRRPNGEVMRMPGAHVEPVQLQVACRALWEQLPSDKKLITTDFVRELGDMDRALSSYYADVLKAVSDETGVPERVLRDWCEFRLITPQGMRGTTYAGASHDPLIKDEVLARLVDAHLIRSEDRAGTAWFELAHDRLIEPIREDNLRWRDANLHPYQRLAQRWLNEGKSDGLLLDGAALKEAQALQRSHSDRVSPTELEFLRRSLEVARTRGLDRAVKSLRRILLLLALGCALILYFGIRAGSRYKELDKLLVEVKEELNTTAKTTEAAESRRLAAEKAERDAQAEAARLAKDSQELSEALSAKSLELERNLQEIGGLSKKSAELEAQLSLGRKKMVEADATLRQVAESEKAQRAALSQLKSTLAKERTEAELLFHRARLSRVLDSARNPQLAAERRVLLAMEAFLLSEELNEQGFAVRLLLNEVFHAYTRNRFNARFESAVAVLAGENSTATRISDGQSTDLGYWVGLDSGEVRFQAWGRAKELKSAILPERPSALLVLGTGEVLAGSSQGGLYRIEGTRWRPIGRVRGFVRALALDGENRLLIGLDQTEKAPLVPILGFSSVQLVRARGFAPSTAQPNAAPYLADSGLSLGGQPLAGFPREPMVALISADSQLAALSASGTLAFSQADAPPRLVKTALDGRPSTLARLKGVWLVGGWDGTELFYGDEGQLLGRQNAHAWLRSSASLPQGALLGFQNGDLAFIPSSERWVLERLTREPLGRLNPEQWRTYVAGSQLDNEAEAPRDSLVEVKKWLERH